MLVAADVLVNALDIFDVRCIFCFGRDVFIMIKKSGLIQDGGFIWK